MIYIHVDGEPKGPFSLDELRALWEEADIGPDAYYWHRRLHAWRPVAQFVAPDPVSLRTPAHAIRLTTGYEIARAEIETELDIVTSECVLGMHVFGDLLALIRDAVGGRSKTMQDALRKARVTCLQELRNEAHTVGADAVIGIDLDYSELTGQGKSMLFLVASGTAVRLVTTPPEFT